MAEDTGTSGLLGVIASKVDFKMSLLKDALDEYREIKHVIEGVAKEKERLQQEKEMLQLEKEMLQHEQHENGEALAAMKEDILASKNKLMEAKNALAESTEEIFRQNSDIEFLKKKLQESEAKNNRAEQQCGSVTELIQPRGVQTRSMQKRKRPSEGPSEYGADENDHTSQLDDRSLSPDHVQRGSMEKQKRLFERYLGDDAANLERTEECPRKYLVDNPPVGQTSGVLVREEDIESVRDELIKGFLEIDIGGRIIGIKEMGRLNEKAFKVAATSELYSSWQRQLGDLSWYPFKTAIVDGIHQEIVNVDDDKLQELKREWGFVVHNAVVNALVEMKEYGCLSDRSIAYELWNYKEGRKATTRECVNYMSNQVKKLKVTKRRKNLRSSSRA